MTTDVNRAVLEKVAKEVFGAKTPEEIEEVIKRLIKSFVK